MIDAAKIKQALVSPRPTELAHMLRSTAAATSPSEAPIRLAKPLQRSMAELMTVTAGPLLAEGHPFEWLTIDGINTSGMTVVCTFDAPPAVASDVFTMAPGVPVWIKGRVVYVWARTLSQNVWPADIGGGAVFWATAGDVPPASAPMLVDGSVAWIIEERVSPVAGTPIEIVSSGDLHHAAGMPLALKLSLAGGNYYGEAYSTDNWPVMLELRQYDDSGTSINHMQAWPFPGDGRCTIVHPIVLSRPKEGTDPYRWSLYVTLPATAAGNPGDVSIVGEIFVGNVEPDWLYSFSKGDHAALLTADVILGYFARRRRHNPSHYERTAIDSLDATAVLTLRDHFHVPEYLGGPYQASPGITTATAGPTFTSALIFSEFEYQQIYFTGAFTSTDEWFGSIAQVA